MAKKKPAKKRPAKKSAKATKKKPAAKAKAKAKKATPKKPAAKKPKANKPAKAPKDDVIEIAFADVTDVAAPPESAAKVEAAAAHYLRMYNEGDIDNAWDVISDLGELDKQLSKTSSLRPEFDKMFSEIETICRESSDA